MLWPRLARSLLRRPLTEAAPQPLPATVTALSERLDAAARRRLGRSLAIRQIDSGSCNGCELELNALSGLVYDLERFGLRFVASPRHADVLLVTGPASRNMTEAMQRAHACMPEPGWVVAVGDCALDGGIFKDSYAVEGGVGAVLPVDLVIPGCPPSPSLVLEGLLALVEAEAHSAGRGQGERGQGERSLGGRGQVESGQVESGQGELGQGRHDHGGRAPVSQPPEDL